MRKDSVASSHELSGSLAEGSCSVMHQRRSFVLRGPHMPVGVVSLGACFVAPEEVKVAANSVWTRAPSPKLVGTSRELDWLRVQSTQSSQFNPFSGYHARQFGTGSRQGR